jgi:hypothetical protein
MGPGLETPRRIGIELKADKDIIRQAGDVWHELVRLRDGCKPQDGQFPRRSSSRFGRMIKDKKWNQGAVLS